MRNAVVAEEALAHSPSRAGGLAAHVEERFRLLGCQLIQQAGLLLRVPQSAVSASQTLLHQYYCRESLLGSAVLDVAMAALFVGCKVGECYRRARDLVNVFHYLYHVARKREWRPMAYICDEYYNWRERLTTAEMLLLRTLGFHVQPANPAVLMVSYILVFDGLFDCERAGIKCSQWALNVLNDAGGTVAGVRFQPPVLACAAMARALAVFGLEPCAPARWHELFDVTPEDLALCLAVMARPVAYDPDLPLVPAELDVYARALDAAAHRPRRPSRSQDRREPRAHSRSPRRTHSRERDRSPPRHRHYR